MIQKGKLAELNKYCDCFLEYTDFKDEHKCLCCNKNYQQKFGEKLRNKFLIHTNFLIMTTVSLFFLL